jgi:hypothetical protein
MYDDKTIEQIKEQYKTFPSIVIGYESGHAKNYFHNLDNK